MAYDVRWHRDDRSGVLVIHDETINWDNLYASFHQAFDLIRSVDHTVDLIIWNRAGMPPGNPMAHIQYVIKNQPSNTGKFYVILPPDKPAVTIFIKRIADIVAKVMPNRINLTFIDSLADVESSTDEKV